MYILYSEVRPETLARYLSGQYVVVILINFCVIVAVGADVVDVATLSQLVVLSVASLLWWASTAPTVWLPLILTISTCLTAALSMRLASLLA